MARMKAATGRREAPPDDGSAPEMAKWGPTIRDARITMND
jgi:hypothetical protein